MSHSKKFNSNEQKNKLKDLDDISKVTYNLLPSGFVELDNNVLCLVYKPINRNQSTSYEVILTFDKELRFEVIFNKETILEGFISENGYSKGVNGTCISVYGNFNIFASKTDPKTDLVYQVLFDMKDVKSINDISNLRVRVKFQKIMNISQPNPTPSHNITSNIKNTLNKINSKNLSINITAQTDYFGLNLGEIYGSVASTKEYSGCYPTKLLGVCDSLLVNLHTEDGLIVTPFSGKPDLQKVLKEKGSTLLSQTKRINKKYGSKLDDCLFYDQIMIYSALKYVFSGLITGNFSDEWLYGKNNDKFYKTMKKSDFADYLRLFTDQQYGLIGFDKYFKYCGNH